MQGIDIKATVDYVSQFETDKVNPTLFTIGMISNRAKLRLFGDVAGQDKDKAIATLSTQLETKAFEVVKAGLRKISNLKIGQEVKEITEITDDVLDMLSIEVLGDIFNKVVEYNFVTEGDRKN